MGKKIHRGFTLPFLLFAAVCLEAAVLQNHFYYPALKLTWTDARMYCRNNDYIDIVTWNIVDEKWLTKWLVDIEVRQIWIGLQRDPGNDSVWKWIDVNTGEGLTGDDLSQSSYWASGQQSSLCAYVSSKLMWYSDRCSSLHSVYCSQGDYFQYYKGSFTWDQGSQQCQENSSTLATISNKNIANIYNTGWIGLYRVAGKNWSWIGDTSNYSNWASDQPLVQDCGSFSVSSEKWYSQECSQKFGFVCFGDNLVVVNENKTWEEALRYCYDMKTPCVDSDKTCIYQYQLLNLQEPEDYSYVRNRMSTATTDEVWMGLRFLAGQWWWMNGQILDDEECPPQQKHCGTLSKYDTGNWTARDCTERRNFICISYITYT